MNILIDHHHGALFKSFYYLTNRLKCNTYVPIGFDWLDVDGLYSCYPNRDTAGQMLNSWKVVDAYKNLFDGISLEEFINKDFDVIICSLLQNYVLFEKIIHKYNKKCKLILHVGNNNHPNEIQNLGVKNLMSSSWPTFIKSIVPNKVFCRQEFSLKCFNPKFDCNVKSVVSLKHILDDEEFGIFGELEKQLKDWNFKCFGAKNRDGIISIEETVMSNTMKEFGFVFHFKKIDEGYGHIIHNAFACGKPVITNSKHMSANFFGENIGNTASLLFTDDTILDINKHSITSISDRLVEMSNNYEYHSKLVYNKFLNTVDFDAEYLDIKKFIDDLL